MATPKDPDILMPARVELGASGKPLLVVAHLARWHHILQSHVGRATEEQPYPVEVLVRRRKRKRTDPQNRYFHAVVVPYVM
jgi:hypothetical protein